MSFVLECKKMKRTGFLTAFLGSGVLAAFVPVLNMAVRSEIYVSINASPVDILLGANWQLMSMLNILVVVAGACIMYNTEHADNAIQRMGTLPTTETALYFGKAAVMTVAGIIVLVMEGTSVFFCSVHWFEQTSDLQVEILKNFGFFLLLMLPTIFLSLLIASTCRNMWISLGIGVICVFLATILPTRNFVLSLFPFGMPFQMLSDKASDVIRNYTVAATLETVGIAISEIILLRVRRKFQ